MLAAAGAAVLWRPGTAVPAGVLVIDAVPWAAVTSIQGEDAKTVALPRTASTPFSMSLPAGSYRIVLTGPPPESRRTELRATVTPAVTTIAPPAQFQMLTPEQYFEPYLGPAAPAAVPEEAPVTQP
jgi:hypothetical protein